MEKVKFLIQMCNFLNNTTGRIEQEELKYLCHYYDVRIDYDDLDRLITRCDVDNVSNIVENDDDELFVKAIKDICFRVRRIILEDSLYDIGRLVDDETRLKVREILEKKF